jgi:multiple antibiotic resistance protein
LRMIFPQHGSFADASEGEPLVVPLAIPLIAGPSTLATLLLLRADTESMLQLWVATTVAWLATATILIGAPFFYRALGERGLVAMERLMGMVLVMISVQMFLNGVATFMAR